MDKLFVRKDVYDELIEKGFGKKDYSKLTKKVITDKNGHKRTVFVKNDVEQTEQKQPKAQEGLTPEKKARYEEMLEKVKAGSDENALFVRGKMLNKKDAIAHLEGKLGKKTVNRAAQKPGIPIQGSNWISLPSGTRVTNEGAKEIMAKNNERIETLKKLMEGNTKADNIRLNSELRSLQNENEYIASRLPSDREEKKPVSSAAQGHLESDEPQNTDITAEDEARFGKQALSGLSGRRTSADEKKTYKASEIERVDRNTLKLGKVTATKESDNSWTIKNAKGEKVGTALYMDVVKKEMVRSANWKAGDSKYPTISRDDKISMLANHLQNKYGGGGTTSVESWKESLKDIPEETLENRFEEYADKHQDEIENYQKNKTGSEPTQDDMKSESTPQIDNYEDAHKYLTKLKPSSSELKNDFEDHRDIVLKRIERGQNFEDAIKTYEKEMKTSVPHMVERGIMSFEEGNNYIKAWEDLKKQI